MQRSQAARGNADRSGSPGERSTRSGAALGRRRRGGRHLARHGGDPGAARALGDREALVDEPLVGLDDDTARHPQPGRQAARRRQPVAGGEPAVADRGAERVGEPGRDAAAGCVGRVELQEVDARHLVLSSGVILALSTGPTLRRASSHESTVVGRRRRDGLRGGQRRRVRNAVGGAADDHAGRALRARGRAAARHRAAHRQARPHAARGRMAVAGGRGGGGPGALQRRAGPRGRARRARGVGGGHRGCAVGVGARGRQAAPGGGARRRDW